jgi:GH15 family glucan-1,4-alpha-glucosidase
MKDMTYRPIESYGIVGDMHTAALIGTDGSIDWLCFPNFDSPAVFAAILDDRKGGRFCIYPTIDGVTHKQFYWPDTNVLITRFLCADGVAEIADFMPIEESTPGEGEHQLIRRVTVVSGSMEFGMECRPAFNFARDSHETSLIGRNGAVFHSSSMSLGLATDVALEKDGSRAVKARFTLEEGQTAVFLLQQMPKGSEESIALNEAETELLFRKTVDYWRRWISQSRYTGRWRETVNRSALLLKLLTYEPTGAIVAAPTCSLPETVGGERNWDYRYTWIRDAAFTLYGLMRIGFTQEAARFMDWLEARCHERRPDGSLQIMYGIDGRHELKEEILDHLDGYRGSRPVRVGNAAHSQLQLDIYGELMDSVYLANKYGNPISYELWTELRELLNWVCDHWKEPDFGIWEVRGGPRHFVYSKVMCWVALDRGIRLSNKRSFPGEHARWLNNRDETYKEILSNGWSSQRSSFVQYFGSRSLDAANLIMPLVFFMSPTDPRMLKTLDATNRTPSRGGLVSNSLVYRYDFKDGVDGISGDEGTFNICTFWLVEALTRAGKFERERIDEARLIFEKMLGYANHLGLFAEQTSRRGEALGNFPQAFTHLALISSAYNLDRVLGKSQGSAPFP